MSTPFTLLLGNPRPGSRTAAVARTTAEAIRDGLASEEVSVAEPQLVDLAELGPHLPARSGGGELPAELDQALHLVRRPGLLLVASPTFKGAYAGLLKLFLDMLPIDGLGRVVAVAAMTAGWPHHRQAGEVHLKPLLAELGASTPVPALSVLESELPDLDTVVKTWTSSHVPTLAAVLWRRQHHAALPGALANDRTFIPTGGN